jgi:hypothetical protein
MLKQRKIAVIRTRTALPTKERQKIFRTTKHCLGGAQTKMGIGLSQEVRIEVEITGEKANKWLLRPIKEHTGSVISQGFGIA